MSWQRVSDSNDLWQRPAEIGHQDEWLYIQDEDGSYIRATREKGINAEAIGGALLINDSSQTPQLTFGHATMQGSRAQQEDRVWVQDSDFLPYCSGAPTAHLMVADGHVGDCAAEFAVRRLPTALKHNMQQAVATWAFSLQVKEKAGATSAEQLKGGGGGAAAAATAADEPTEVPPVTPAEGGDFTVKQDELTTPGRKRVREEEQDENVSPRSKVRRKTLEQHEQNFEPLYTLLSEAITTSYSEVDSDFLRMNKTSKSGSTCSSITILGSFCVFANIGDSRMILVKHPSPHQLTPPSENTHTVVRMSAEHKPGHDGEKNRITQAGGTVRRIGGCWRVLPDVDTGYRTGIALAVSRSFGDRMLKKYVISEPDVTVLDLQPNIDAALVVATDGVWDTIDDQTAGKLVYSHHESRDANRAARELIKAAYHAGSEDNISCAIAFIYGS